MMGENSDMSGSKGLTEGKQVDDGEERGYVKEWRDDKAGRGLHKPQISEVSLYYYITNGRDNRLCSLCVCDGSKMNEKFSLLVGRIGLVQGTKDVSEIFRNRVVIIRSVTIRHHVTTQSNAGF